jgi:ubiquinone/menaquinone biosynthesis C-methylase UbiE
MNISTGSTRLKLTKGKQSLFPQRGGGKRYQEKFFDESPGLYPWPSLLVETGFAKSHKLRDLKFKKYLDLLKIKKREKVLDVGCGQGIFLARVVKTYGAKGVGVDISKRSIATAKQWPSSRLSFQVADAARLPFPDKSFDHVLSFDFLEHVENQKKSLAEMVRVLKPGGSLLIYTINCHQRYTWNLLLDKLGVDIYQNVAHDPRLFLDPGWVKKELGRMGIKVKQLELFGSFFTLAVDEAMMILFLVFKKLNLFDSSSRFKMILGRVFLNLTNLFSHLFLVPLEVLEIPWKKAGYSNSFFILGRKERR